MKRIFILFAALVFFCTNSVAQNSGDLEDVVDSFKGLAEDFGVLFGKSGKVVVDDQISDNNGKLSVNTGNPSVDLRLKRCRAIGDDVEIDLMITSHQKWTVVSFMPKESQCIDDMPHTYKSDNIWFEIDGERQQRNPDLIT